MKLYACKFPVVPRHGAKVSSQSIKTIMNFVESNEECAEVVDDTTSFYDNNDMRRSLFYSIKKLGYSYVVKVTMAQGKVYLLRLEK